MSAEMMDKRSLVAGWIAVASSTLLACLLGYWGAIENFHEGWYYRELWRNLALMMVQYMPWMLLPILAGLLSLWSRIGGIIIHAAFAVAALVLFGFHGAGMIWISIPLLFLGSCYLFGSPRPLKWARRILVFTPVVAALISGSFAGYRVLTRPKAVDKSERQIQGEGLSLIWAPAGPGWTESSMPWQEAKGHCEYLTADGKELAGRPLGIWRLPTVQESVRTMIYRGENAGGRWDPKARKASYRVMPDKEAPLWDPYSPVIYWWTATEAGDGRVYRIAYNGYVHATSKKSWMGCRCVKDPDAGVPLRRRMGAVNEN